MGSETLLTMISTVLMSGALAAIVTFRLNARRDDRLIRQERLEQLYEAFFEVKRRLASYWVPYLAVMNDRISYDKALEITVEEKEYEPLPIARMEMLATMYHPVLLPLVEELLEIRDQGNTVIHLHKEEYRRVGSHRSTAVQMMEELSNRLTDLEETFRRAVRVQAEVG